jgi:hypothetical protein
MTATEIMVIRMKATTRLIIAAAALVLAVPTVATADSILPLKHGFYARIDLECSDRSKWPLMLGIDGDQINAMHVVRRIVGIQNIEVPYSVKPPEGQPRTFTRRLLSLATKQPDGQHGVEPAALDATNDKAFFINAKGKVFSMNPPSAFDEDGGEWTGNYRFCGATLAEVEKYRL